MFSISNEVCAWLWCVLLCFDHKLLIDFCVLFYHRSFRITSLELGKLYVKWCWRLWVKSFNSLWPSDAIWWQGFGATLARVMAWCLMASNRYQNQFDLSSTGSCGTKKVHSPGLVCWRLVDMGRLAVVITQQEIGCHYHDSWWINCTVCYCMSGWSNMCLLSC